MKSTLQLDDCTKDELIHFIRQECFYSLKRLDFTVLMYRASKASEASSREDELAIKALGEYANIMKSYEGMKLVDVPCGDIAAANAAHIRYMKHSKNSDNLNKKYKKIHKEIDLVLGRE